MSPSSRKDLIPHRLLAVLCDPSGELLGVVQACGDLARLEFELFQHALPKLRCRVDFEPGCAWRGDTRDIETHKKSTVALNRRHSRPGIKERYAARTFLIFH